MKRNGNIDAVGIIAGRAGMEDIRVAEQPVSLVQVINGVVDLVKHLTLENNGQLDFLMPVPEKRFPFIARKLFITDMNRKFIGSV